MTGAIPVIAMALAIVLIPLLSNSRPALRRPRAQDKGRARANNRSGQYYCLVTSRDADIRVMRARDARPAKRIVTMPAAKKTTRAKARTSTKSAAKKAPMKRSTPAARGKSGAKRGR